MPLNNATHFVITERAPEKHINIIQFHIDRVCSAFVGCQEDLPILGLSSSFENVPTFRAAEFLADTVQRKVAQ